MQKHIILASFIFPERVDWFIDYLGSKFNIQKDKIFGYKNLNDESKIIVTFKLIIDEGKFLDLKNLFPSAITIHKKGNVFYTINALNKLIDSINNGTVGNIDYKSVKVDWAQYQNKFIIIENKELKFLPIERVF